MPSVSSLLKSAQATQKKMRQQEDAFVAFEWENSAQTYDDFVEYSKYLTDRVQTAGDPSDALSYQVKLRSANRSFTSNEIQRAQMSIMEGRGDTSTKMEAIRNLWDRAVAAEDFNLAQNLFSQYDALSIKLQNEQEAAVKEFQAKAAAGYKVYDELQRDLTKGYEDVTLPTGEKVTPLAAIARDLEQNETSDVAAWQAAQDTMEAIQNVVIDQYQNAPDQDTIDKLEEKYGPGLADIGKELTFKVGGRSLTAQQVVNAVANEQFNNPIYSRVAEYNPATGKNEFKLKENNVDNINYARRFNPETGMEEYQALEVRTDANDLYFGSSDQTRGLNTQLTNEGSVIGAQFDKNGKKVGKINAGTADAARDDSQTIGNRLAALGVIARTNGTTLMIKLPGESVERQATIQPDGSIRYFGEDGRLLEFGLTRRNLGTDAAPMVYEPGQSREVSYDEISDFSQESRMAPGRNISEASQQGKRYTQSITGQSRVDTPLPNGAPIRVGNDFSGFGGAAGAGAFQGGTSALLQGAGQTRKAIEVENQRKLMLQAQEQAAALQATNNAFDLNQTPVQQLANNGVLKRQLSVAAPQAPRRVYVAPAAPTPRISSVSVAPRTQNITGVSVAGPQPRIRF
jgi:hypothetical protein